MKSPYVFAANTGFLWKELDFLLRLTKASQGGFAALEFHDEAQREDRAKLKDLLERLELPVISLNTQLGDTFGCAAIPQMARQARSDIAEAAQAAKDIGADAIHVVAGKIEKTPESDAAYEGSLRHALEVFSGNVLIEPITGHSVPGYFMQTAEQAREFIDMVDDPRLRLLFDCYHIQHDKGECLETFKEHAGVIGHVQIASYPARAEPIAGEIDYPALLPAMKAAGYEGAFGCEYLPATTVEQGLGWWDAYTK